MSHQIISGNNTKVHCRSFNTTCPESCEYCTKTERLFKRVKPHLITNRGIFNDPNFESFMTGSINLKKDKFFRWFAHKGDVMSVTDCVTITDIAFNTKKCTHYTYTKQWHLWRETFKTCCHKSKNLIVSASAKQFKFSDIPETSKGQVLKIPKGFDGYTLITKNESTCLAQLNKGCKCMRDCFRCAEKGNITIFKLR